MTFEPGLLLWLWIFVVPMVLLAFAVRHERRAQRLRYRPPPQQPGDDWGGGTSVRLGWWNEP